ncbi:hypothetical protein [Methylobacterium sp. J-068]|uniref:hypothetical protein n=1 Tax=Methylobacterium sp. J-068 TaxID=2836649 RepID=UPI001FBA855B|nr:hypothetical protein [Methylobacterium sp. J-068]MCJ2035240.1 hypothetical protein [Methylobacterium sp. J-068]
MPRHRNPYKPPKPYVPDLPDHSPTGLAALAERIEERQGSGFFVPGSSCELYAKALRALAREKAARTRSLSRPDSRHGGAEEHRRSGEGP